MRTFAKLKQFFQIGSKKKQPADCCLSCRSLRPKKRQDEPMFLSDVYNRCTQAKKQPADCCLSGRSMVEMLGVLAIIGVLSVGAIAGYSKAMMKHKLNKQTAQISDLLNNSLATSSQFPQPTPNPGSSSAYQLIPYYKKMGIIPAEMIKETNNDSVYDVFGNTISVAYISWDPHSYMELSIYFSQTEKDYLQCINTLTLLKELHSNLYSVSINRHFSDNSTDFVSRIVGDEPCPTTTSDTLCLKDLSLADMEKLCNVCTDTTICRLITQYNYK